MALVPLTPDASRSTPALTLVTLETQPCGCVTAVYRAQPGVVEVDVVEAKGPHCLFFGHRTGQVVRLGMPGPPDIEGDEPRI
jgi:hypothetical protein